MPLLDWFNWASFGVQAPGFPDESPPFTLTDNSYRMDFSNKENEDWYYTGAGNRQSCSDITYQTSLTPTIPSTATYGDILIMYAKGSHAQYMQTWNTNDDYDFATNPDGWILISSASQDMGSGQRYNSLTVWYKKVGINEPNPIVSLTSNPGSGIQRGWSTQIFCYHSNVFYADAMVVSAPEYVNSSGSSGSALIKTLNYEPVSRNNLGGTEIYLVAAAGYGGILSIVDDNGWFRRYSISTNTPTLSLFDKQNVEPYSYFDYPSVTVGVDAWFMSIGFSILSGDRKYSYGSADQWGYASAVADESIQKVNFSIAGNFNIDPALTWYARIYIAGMFQSLLFSAEISSENPVFGPDSFGGFLDLDNNPIMYNPQLVTDNNNGTFTVDFANLNFGGSSYTHILNVNTELSVQDPFGKYDYIFGETFISASFNAFTSGGWIIGRIGV
jgi:hypothetical protein